MRTVFLLWAALLALLAPTPPAVAQTRYRAYNKADNTTIYRKESAPNYGSFDLSVGSLPAGAQIYRGGARVLLPYAPENKASFNPAQFGQGKYYAPNYFFSIDFNPNGDNVATRKAQGVSMFTRFVQPSSAEYSGLPTSQKFYYQFDNEIHGPLEGRGYFESSLADMEARYYSVIPSGQQYYAPNIEFSVTWNRQQYETGALGYDDWNTAKRRSIKLESVANTTMTLEQLDASGLWPQEAQVRRANRDAIRMAIARSRNNYVADGTSMFQGEPRTNSLQTTGLFREGVPNLTHIGGDAQGNITLNGRAYSGLTKNVYGYETSMLDYYYYFGWQNFKLSDYNEIWIEKKAGTQTMPYIWSRMEPYHIVASEKGHWQANRARMSTPGQSLRGTVRMQEPFFEGQFYTEDFAAHESFVPFAELQSITVDGYQVTPKVWLPPYYTYSAYVVHRFLEGATPGSGYHLFNGPGVTKLPTSHPLYNHHLHTVSSLYQARADMQPYEQFYYNSTLLVDPQVQIGASGSWSAYSGCDAFAFDESGSRGTPKPAYMARYKAVPGGTRVVIVGGMVQGFTTERTDAVRLTLPGSSSPTIFRIKLRGPHAQAFDFFVPSGESGQTYSAEFTAQPSWEAPAYAGRIGSASTSPTTPTTPTTDCNFSVAVNSPSVGCGSTANLTATATGSGASGLQYNWTGPNGFTASGASIAVQLAQANGSYQYTVTAAKNGCAARSATATVTVSGCQTTPQPPVGGSFSYQVPTSQTPWMGNSSQKIGFQNLPIGDFDYLENDFLRVEIRRGLGCLVQVFDKLQSPNRALINSPDLGRGDGPSSYTEGDYTNNINYRNPDGSQKFTYNGKNPSPGPWFTGRNPLKDGDWAGHPATVLFHGRITIDGVEYIYFKTQLNSWSHDTKDTGYLLKMYLEQWVALQGKIVRQYTRLTQDHDDLTDYGPYMQEWRLMMVNGFMREAVYYNRHSPYTYDGVTRSNAIERGDQNTGFVTPGRALPVSEPWFGVTIDRNNTNRVIAHYAPDLYYPSYNAMDQHEGGECDGCRTGMYTSGHVMANLDAKGVWYFRDDWIVGDINADVRAYVYAQERVVKPDWVFNATTQRNFWYGNNGVNDGQLPNAANDSQGWAFRMNGKADGGPANIDNTYISSPRTAFKGGDCPTLYVVTSLKNTTQGNWKIKYTYVGQDREYIDSGTPNENEKRFPYSPKVPDASQQVPFNITPDGQKRVIAIPMNWNANSYISTVELWANGSNLQTKSDFEVSSIGCIAK